MGVYVKEMGMPDCCLDCPLYNGHGCKATLQMFHPTTNIAVRVDICPLVEVEMPHARLIDADALCERLMKEWRTADENGKKIISEVMADVVTPIVVGTPTVIESEG